MRENAAILCFNLDFASYKKESRAPILGSVLNEMLGGLGEVLERIVKAF